MNSRHGGGRRDIWRRVRRPEIGNEAPGRPPGIREEKGHMRSDGECLPGTYPAQNDTRKIKAVKFKR